MVEILIHYSIHKDWGKAFTTVLPARKNASLKQQDAHGGNSSDEDDDMEKENAQEEHVEEKDMANKIPNEPSEKDQ